MFPLLLCAVSCYSLFPLLFEAQEYPIKVVLLLLHAVLMLFGFCARFPGASSTTEAAVKGRDKKSESRAFHVGWIGKSYLVGLVVVEIWGQFLHPIIFGDGLPFLPLMMISIYCALGMLYSWAWQLTQIVRTN